MTTAPQEGFCGSEFWNSTLTWNTNDPDFTSCFQRSVLVWAPCALLWLFSFLDVYYIKININRNIPRGFLNVSKLALTLALILLSLIDLAVVFFNNESQIFPVDYYTPAIKIATFALSAALLEYNRSFGLRSSGLQFLFWFLLLLCGLPQLRSQIRWRIEQSGSSRDRQYAEYDFISYIVFYGLAFIIWFLNFFADKAPLDTKYPKTNRPCPDTFTSYPTRLFYAWFDSFIWKGYKKPLENEDLWDINAEETTKEVLPAFNKYWNRSQAKSSASNPTYSNDASIQKNCALAGVKITASKKKKQASVLPAIFKAFGPAFLVGNLFKLFSDLLLFASPQILRLIIRFVETSDGNPSDGVERQPIWHGILFAIGLFTVANLNTLLDTFHSQRMSIVGQRIRTSLIAVIYRKALILSNAARKESTVGEIVNLMAVDAQRFKDLTEYIHMVWSAPLQIALALYFLWNLLGPSVLAGLAVMIALIPINAVISTKMKTVMIEQMKRKDERIKMINELLGGIKVLKLYAWEPCFEDKVEEVRVKEIKVLTKSAYLHSAIAFIWTCTPFIVVLVTFTTFVLSDDSHVLNAETAFVSLSLFNTLNIQMMLLPYVISSIIQTSVALKRINKFMNSEDLDPLNISHDEKEEAPLVVENGTFSWGDDEPTLRNINMRVEKNSLVAVVGSVGSGKSSLISANLGEMDKIAGRVNTVGTIAYVPQQAWIQNCTLQDNILFGKPLDRKRYDQVIAACALKPDIEMLPAGDQTEIGEKGINLSGGQKQRVSLARAVYFDAEIYFLDDPLSAVDSHVGKHIFEQVIGPNGLLANKTRVLVTHGVTYLHEVDNIFVLKDGEISESGSMQELINKKGAFADFLLQHLQEATEEDEEIFEDIKHQLESSGDAELLGKLERVISRTRSESISESGSLDGRTKTESNISGDGLRRRSLSKQNSTGDITSAAEDDQKDKLIEEETAEVGRVKWDVYKHYFKNIGIWFAILGLFCNIGHEIFAVGTNIWLARWSNDRNADTDTSVRDMYLGGYAAIGIGLAIFAPLVHLLPRLGCLMAAKKLHKILLNGILHAPIAFFDTTPAGRILSRFSKDIEALDSTLPRTIPDTLYFGLSVVAAIIVISVSTYMFLFAIVPIAIVYFFLQQMFIATSRQLSRLESVSRSPVYSHFSESVQGAPTIRAYNLEDRFVVESDAKVDFNLACSYPRIIANMWILVRLETLGNLIVFLAALFAVLSHDIIDAGTAALSITYALQVTQTLNWLVRIASDVETNIVAVERIKEYGDTKQEAPWELARNDLPKNWPDHGMVQFKDFNVRYREGLDLVLRGVTFTVHGGEKVGIVGRTGAGKSSLTLSLFRIIESAGGSILIDGQDISTLGLHTLRSKLTIIPQDPVLFSGSLRINLDPFGRNSDDEVWRALELAHLKSFVKGLSAGLNHEVSEGGENLSVGQRQLICLARALLRKTKVLILDEATAAIDLETDDLIQKTIRSEFKECTILTIAHRLNTILDSDKVIVLDKGTVSEFASPNDLLLDKSSAFYSMAKDAGLVT